MPSVHQWAVDTATRLIKKHGRAVQLVTTAESADSWNMSASTTSELVAEVVVVNTQYKAEEVDGNLIRATDKRYLMDSQHKPTTGMQVRDGGVDYEIKSAEPLYPGTDVIFYDVQARL